MSWVQMHMDALYHEHHTGTAQLQALRSRHHKQVQGMTETIMPSFFSNDGRTGTSVDFH